MASPSSTLCGVCDSQHLTTDATFWCPECDEGLCSTCLKYHNASKLSKNHEVISVDNYRHLPSFVASIHQYCPDHEKKYQLYCLQHERLCCPLCVTTSHKKCDLAALDEVIKTFKASAIFDDLEEILKEIKQNLKRIIEDREENLSKVQQSREKIKSVIQTMRDKINKHLDSIEQKILQDLSDVETEVNSEIQRIHTNILDHRKTVEDIEINISTIKEYASDLQIFVGMKEIELDIEREEMFIVSFLEGGNLQHVDIDFHMDNKMSDILCIAGYGKISRIESSSKVAIKTEKNRQALYLVPTPFAKKTIYDINISSHRKLRIPEANEQSRFTGCTITPSGKIILVDWNYHTVFVLNENESLKFKKTFPSPVFDVCCVDDRTIAISHGCSTTQIEIINLSSMQTEKQIRTSNECSSITNEQGRLIYYLAGTGIQSVDLSGDDLTTIVKQPEISGWNYVTAFGGKLFHTNPTINTVTCYNITGEKVWEYKNKSVFRDIRGVTTDQADNVYVVCAENNSIVVISPDGKHARHLVWNDGLDEPYGIHFDKTRNNLLISCYNAEVHMYKVS